jgi:antirestriction protein ArdC
MPMTKAERHEMEQEALSRAIGAGPLATMTNYPDIFRGFMAKGIAESDIRPRENVFTYHAWRALGRQVRRGEHGVKITSWAPWQRKECDAATGQEKVTTVRRCVTAVVFHISQTDPIPGQKRNHADELLRAELQAVESLL